MATEIQSTVQQLNDLASKANKQSKILATQLSLVTQKILEMENSSLEKIRLAQQRLEMEVAQFEALKQEVEKRAANAQDKIRLNIGGMLFTVAKQTLLVPNSFFHAMLGSDRWKPDEDGEYFIDRDPTLFPRVLNYLRSSEWNIDGLSLREKELLKIELDFYQIDVPYSLYYSCDSFVKFSQCISVTNRNRTITSITDKGTAVTNPLPRSGTYTCVITINQFAKKSNPWTCVGIAEEGQVLSTGLFVDQKNGSGLYIDKSVCNYRSSGITSSENLEIGPAHDNKVITVIVNMDRKTIQFASSEKKNTGIFFHSFCKSYLFCCFTST